MLYYSTFFSEIKEDGRLFHKKVETVLPILFCVSSRIYAYLFIFSKRDLLASYFGKQISFPAAYSFSGVIFSNPSIASPGTTSSMNTQVSIAPSAIISININQNNAFRMPNQARWISPCKLYAYV